MARSKYRDQQLQKALEHNSAMHRKIERLDDLVPLLREALQNLEEACEQLAATRSRRVYDAMIEDGQTEALLSLDARRHAAREILRRFS